MGGIRGQRALIVEGSSVSRQLLSRTLRPYCAAITAVAGIAEARAHLDEGSVSLVVLDATVEGALAWLEESRAWASRPAFVVVTSQPSQDEETCVSLLGAIGYLAKPIAARELSHVLVSSRR